MTSFFSFLLFTVVFLVFYIIIKSIKTFFFFSNRSSGTGRGRNFNRRRNSKNIEDAEYTEIESKLKPDEEKNRNGGK